MEKIKCVPVLTVTDWIDSLTPAAPPPEFFEQEALNLAKKEKRFVRIHSDGTLSGNEIWVDTQTGVNYFYHSAGYGGGLTVLLDRDGKPVISPLPVQDAD